MIGHDVTIIKITTIHLSSTLSSTTAATLHLHWGAVLQICKSATNHVVHTL